MRYTQLGRSGLEVSRVAFGTWQLGGDWGDTDEEKTVAAIRKAADEGVTLFNTAQAYGFGASERLLARALRGRLRDELVIATKCGVRPQDGGVTREASLALDPHGSRRKSWGARHRLRGPLPGPRARAEGPGRAGPPHRRLGLRTAGARAPERAAPAA